MSEGESSQITGSTIQNICKLYAAYLCARIYHEPEGHSTAGQRFKEQMEKTKKLWQQIELDDDQAEFGMVAAFYRPTGASNGDEGEKCWPMLVFRGTDFDDFRGLGFSFTLTSPRLEKQYTDDEIATAFMTDDIGFATENAYKALAGYAKQKWVEPNIANARQMLEPVYVGSEKPIQQPSDGPYLSIGWVANHPEIQTAAQAEALAGYKKIELLNQKGQLGIGPLSDEYHVTASLVYNENSHGDWVTNLLQGMGKESPAYKRALAFANQCYLKYIQPDQEKKLVTTGHSLGGGMASAANMFLRQKYIKEGLDCYGLVFNPAGVHENTIKPAHLSDGKIEIVAVKDEILTTLAWYKNNIPFLGPILKLSNFSDGLPQPYGSKMILNGVSPGPLAGNESWEVPPRDNLLARLFPLSEQNALWQAKATHQFKKITAINDMLLNAGSLNSSIKNISEYILKTLISDSDFDIKEEVNDLLKILDMSAGYHSMDFCIATYEAKLKGKATSVYSPYQYADENSPEDLNQRLKTINKNIKKQNDELNKYNKDMSQQYQQQFSNNGGLTGIKF